MACMITLKKLLGACAGDSFDDGIRIDTDLVPKRSAIPRRRTRWPVGRGRGNGR